ncbi:ArsR/SmtB family transcription factor [Pontibacter amylolyticus]|uniref:Transcriptional regulator n=1 Tax=Pontibacter amylolyticus TaxID=1424080 RepID=A0ABQ1W5C9_9BACT|nr:metalloregulator ArsR/SmtB family transcription factor [Pontibacter amylolyticus]GGG15828.1 transcriptional regulator [Pontibacter amylolyticus]
MELTKTAQFTDEDILMARYAKALGHPARIAILRVLLERKACICGDIVDELPLSQSTVSQHLKELKDVGLIQGDIDGKKVCYCINEQVWKQAQETLGALFQRYTSCDSSCC